MPISLLLVSVVAAFAQAGNQPSIPASAAAQNIGKTTVVCGVIGAVRSVRGGDAVYLEGDAPNQGLTVVIPDAGRFDAATRTRAAGVRVCASGKIERDRDGVVMKIKDLRSLRAVPGDVERAANFGGPDALDLRAGRKVPGVVDPRLRTSPQPRYTSLAMGAAVQGDVEMDAVIRADGTVGPIRVTRSLDALYGLDVEAMRSASTWTFTPAQRDGQPVSVIVTIVMTFRLH